MEEQFLERGVARLYRVRRRRSRRWPRGCWSIREFRNDFRSSSCLFGLPAFRDFDSQLAGAFLHARLQFVMGGLQGVVARLDLAEHVVETVGQVPDFILASSWWREGNSPFRAIPRTRFARVPESAPRSRSCSREARKYAVTNDARITDENDCREAPSPCVELAEIGLQIDRADFLSVHPDGLEQGHGAVRNCVALGSFGRWNEVRIRAGARVFCEYGAGPGVDAGFDDVRLGPQRTEGLSGGLQDPRM